MKKQQISDHLNKCMAFHTKMAASDVTKSQVCQAAATMCEKAMSDSSLGDVFATLGQHLFDDAEAHVAHGKHCMEMCKAVEEDTDDDSEGIDDLKVLGARDFSKAIPTRVQAVVPDVPVGVRLIGRTGGPPLPGDGTEDATEAIDRLAKGA